MNPVSFFLRFVPAPRKQRQQLGRVCRAERHHRRLRGKRTPRLLKGNYPRGVSTIEATRQHGGHTSSPKNRSKGIDHARRIGAAPRIPPSLAALWDFQPAISDGDEAGGGGEGWLRR